MKPRLFTPETSETRSRPTAVRGAHAALVLFAVAGLGVTIAASLVANDLYHVASLVPQRTLAYCAGLVYLLWAALLHGKIFLDLGRTQPICRWRARMLLAAHGVVALAVLYSFAVQRLASRALLVGLDPLLSSTAILSVLACVVALAMVTQRQPHGQPDTRYGLWQIKLFFGVCLLFAGSILWLELSPLP